MAENSNELLIKIRAELGDLKKGLTDANKKIEDFGDKAETSAKKTESLGKKGKEAVPGLNDLSNSLQKLGGEAGAVGNKMEGGLSILSKFGKGLGALAPAGTAAILALGVFGVALGAAAVLLYENRDAILEYIAGINDITRAFDKSAGSIGTQIGKLERLKDAYLDSNTSQEDKAKIMAKLQKDYPDYFKSLKDEEDNVADVQTAYENQKKAIVGLGIVKALEAQKAPLYAKIVKLHLKEELSLIDKIALALSTMGGIAQGGIAAGIGNAILGDGVGDIQAEIDKINEAIGKIDIKYDLDLSESLGLNDLKTKTKEVLGELKDFSGAFSEESLIFQEIAGKIGKGISGAADPIDEFVTALNVTGLVQSTTIAGTAFSNLAEDLNDFNDSQPDWLKVPKVPLDVLEANKKEMADYTSEMTMLMSDFSQDLENLIAGAMADTFISLGEDIGTALAEGESVIGAVGSSLLNSLGKFLGELGKMLISYGTLAIAKGLIDIALNSGVPWVMIAAGAAAIVVGIALVATSSAMANKAGGGSSSAGSRSAVGAGGYSSSTGGSRSTASSGGGGGGGTYVFEIQGTKLVGVISNTLKRNNALGGSLTLSTTPTT